jgi:ABC-type multidrug transport system ATPase subunit
VSIKKEMFDSFVAESDHAATAATAAEDEDDAYDELTVEELVSLLQNFKGLDKENQVRL